MRSKTAIWFETKVQYDKIMENGLEKKVTEQYVVDAMSLTEAESVIIKEMKPYISGDFFVKAIKRASFNETLFSDKESDDRYFKAKVQFISIDEKTEKEKRSNVVYLVQTANIDVARNYIKEHFKHTLIDYETVQLADTPILDVFEHE